MPLDTTLYHLSHSHLRLDGRRWNELRRCTAHISTSPSADGSAYLEMGNTKVICTVAGPSQQQHPHHGRREAGGGGGGGDKEEAVVGVEVGIAGFSGVERRKGSSGRGDRRTTEMQHTLASAFQTTLFTHLYPHSTILVSLYVLSQDGSVLAACLNAGTLALIDAGIPMSDYVVACTAGLVTPTGSGSESESGYEAGSADPLLDLNGTEEQELPWLTVGTVGAGERVSVLVMESRVPVGRLEGMLAVGVDGCKQVREILDGAVRRQGKRVLQSVVLS